MLPWILGNRKFISNRLGFLSDLRERGGRISSFEFAQRKFHLVCEPSLVREVLVNQQHRFHKGQGLRNAKPILGEGLLTSEDAFHRQHRRIMQPVFNRQKVLEFAPTMLDCAARYQEHWTEGARLDLGREMTQLTLNIVGKTLFDTDAEQDFAEIEPIVTDLRALFRVILNPLHPLLVKLVPGLRKKFQGSKQRLDQIIYRMIEDHQRIPRNDLLGMLLVAFADEPALQEVVRDEVVTLYLAGHETTAYALTWTLWFLSFHPHIRGRIREELQGHQLGPDSYGKLTYLEGVVLETLRIYPPVWIFGRTCLENLELEGLDLKKDDLVLLSPFLLHRDPDFFPDPLTYRPERWLETPRTSLPKYCYFPFGAGARVCIGEHFALLETILSLGSMFSRWDFLPVFGNPVNFDAGVTLRPSPKAYVKLARL
jgi:cytochrome P450